jgi:triacylglycerol lipase
MNIVLAHGVLGFGKFAEIRYFNGVADHLRRMFPGTCVRTSVVPPLGTTDKRAHALAEEIEHGFHQHEPDQDQLDASEPINIVAHSMGGLDSRFLLAHHLLDPSRRVTTLTCIGTPHFGSPVASLLNAFNPFQILSVLPIPGSGHFDEVRAELNAVTDLSEAGARAIDSSCPDLTDGTQYFEVAGIGRPSGKHTSAFFGIPFSLLALAGVQNDGVVPFESATRGRTPLEIWSGDHADLVGHDLDQPLLFGSGAFNHLAAYESVIRKVAV